jgi:cytidylate kinase
MVRDRLDSTRSDAPLKQAADALYLDTTGLTTAAVIEQLLALVAGSGSDSSGSDTSSPRGEL